MSTNNWSHWLVITFWYGLIIMTYHLKIFVIFHSLRHHHALIKNLVEKNEEEFLKIWLCKCQCNNVVQTEHRFFLVSKLTLQRRLNVAENSLSLLMIWRKLSMVKWFWRRNSLKLPLTKTVKCSLYFCDKNGRGLISFTFFPPWAPWLLSMMSSAFIHSTSFKSNHPRDSGLENFFPYFYPDKSSKNWHLWYF